MAARSESEFPTSGWDQNWSSAGQRARGCVRGAGGSSPVCAARSAHGSRLDTSASVATTSFDEVFCNINLGMASVNRALLPAGSQPTNNKRPRAEGARGKGLRDANHGGGAQHTLILCPL